MERETNTEGMSFKQLEQRIYVETEKVLHNLVEEKTVKIIDFDRHFIQNLRILFSSTEFNSKKI